MWENRFSSNSIQLQDTWARRKKVYSVQPGIFLSGCRRPADSICIVWKKYIQNPKQVADRFSKWVAMLQSPLGALSSHILSCRGEQRKPVCSQHEEQRQEEAEKTGQGKLSLLWWLSSSGGDTLCPARECLHPSLTPQHPPDKPTDFGSALFMRIARSLPLEEAAVTLKYEPSFPRRSKLK